jgi:protein-disulfide isomerase
MSRKSKRNAAPAALQPSATPSSTPAAAPSSTSQPSPSSGRRGLLIGVGATVLVAAVGGGLLYAGRLAGAGRAEADPRRSGLGSEHSPSVGDPAARVHIVEFLDPACGTCATFYPLVKQMMADNPGRIRLSVRHVPFHKGADEVVRMLEASRAQGKYWQVLETLLATQDRWAPRHTAQPDLARQVIAATGLDFARLDADMRAPEVGQRMALDMTDARLLSVEQTPEYFVNGRQMPSFGPEQLQTLVRQAVKEAY